jgi:hypothetical protein
MADILSRTPLRLLWWQSACGTSQALFYHLFTLLQPSIAMAR